MEERVTANNAGWADMVMLVLHSYMLACSWLLKDARRSGL